MAAALAAVACRTWTRVEQGGEYLTKLLKVFSDCEDLDDEESLRLLCHIFKAIVGLNDATLLEVSEREGFDCGVRFFGGCGSSDGIGGRTDYSHHVRRGAGPGYRGLRRGRENLRNLGETVYVCGREREGCLRVCER